MTTLCYCLEVGCYIQSLLYTIIYIYIYIYIYLLVVFPFCVLIRYFTSTKMKVYAAFGECLPQSGRQLGYVEQVTLIMTIRETRRSSTILDLVSPSGTRVRILYPRPRDTRRSGLFRWPVSTSFFWGEQPQGVWTMEVCFFPSIVCIM